MDALLHRIAAWYAGRPPHTRVLLCLATVMLVVELLFRWLAPRSRAHQAWTRFFESIGKVWTAVLLALIYALSVGPISLVFRLLGRDPLDRRLRAEPSYWRGHEANPLGPEQAVRHQF